MNFPKELKYTKDHEWVKIDGDTVIIGVTDFAQKQLGDIVFVEIETQGEVLQKGDIYGTIEAVKTVSDMYMPITGEILEVNPDLGDSPEIVNEDPYGKGWMIKVRIDNKSELEELYSVEDYKKEVE